MRTFSLISGVLIFTALLSGCGNNNLPTYDKLESLRVINIISSAPEVNPGDTVTLTPWISDSKGDGRALTFSAASCTDPGIGYGADPTCEGSNTKVVIATNVAITGLSAANAYTNAVNTFTVTVPDLATVFARHRLVEIYNGVAYLVTYSIQVPGGETVHSFKRIVVSTSTKTTKNLNPVFTSVQVAGSEISSYPTSDVDFVPVFGPGSVETYTAKQDDGVLTSPGTDVTVTEVLTTTWFITAGSMKFQHTLGTDSDKFSTELPKPAVFRLVGVTRDGRGGVAIKDYTF